jgi:hypothetical protein
MAVDTCCVVERGCLSPANVFPQIRVRTACFACGQPVCTNADCSTRIRWYTFGVKRICTNCQDEARRKP